MSASTNQPSRILGIDPGSRNLGYGLVTKSGNKLQALAHGTLKFDTKTESNERLLEIFTRVRALIAELKPDAVAIEKVFFAKNASSAFKLGAARGVVILAVVEAGLSIAEYNPTEVKQAVTGHGHAEKDQVAKLVSLLLGVRDFASADASDALAIAICHTHHHGTRANQLKRALARP